jgi:hypothetical protein
MVVGMSTQIFDALIVFGGVVGVVYFVYIAYKIREWFRGLY